MKKVMASKDGTARRRNPRAGILRRSLWGVTLASLLLAVIAVAPAQAHDDDDDRDGDRAEMVREWNNNGTAASGNKDIGETELWRSKKGLVAKVEVEDLRPGGVYTFWWVVIQNGGASFPADVHVQRGAGVVVDDDDGEVELYMSARVGDKGIKGFPALGGAAFGTLHNAENTVVRIEIAYHGQVKDAGANLPVWLSDFWTGEACPPATPNPNPDQPHCPVYFAATYMP